MRKTSYLIVLMMMLSFSEFGYTNSSKNETQGIPYINLNYLKCLQDSLPCECEESVRTDFFIILDTNNINQGQNLDIEVDEVENYYGIYTIQAYTEEFYKDNIVKITPNRYNIIADNLKKTQIGAISLHNDTLYYIDSFNRKSTLIRYGQSLSPPYDNDYRSLYQAKYFNYLNQAFIRRGYPPLTKILKSDYLYCDCTLNFGTTIGKWVIERNGDYIEFYTYTTPEDYAIDVPLVQNKKLFKRYKW